MPGVRGLLRNVADAVASRITHSKSFSVPVDFKHAEVTLISKRRSRGLRVFFRVASKVFEKIVHDQTYEYICSHNLLYEFQYSFRKCCSTGTLFFIYLTDFIRKEIDFGNGMCGPMLLDLQKAFDTVILLTKLMACGIDSTVLSWMTSYQV